jgi:hypothetical protein
VVITKERRESEGGGERERERERENKEERGKTGGRKKGKERHGVYQPMNGERKCGIYNQWTIIHKEE